MQQEKAQRRYNLRLVSGHNREFFSSQNKLAAFTVSIFPNLKKNTLLLQRSYFIH